MPEAIQPTDWQNAMELDALREAGAKIVKVGAKQIALFDRDGEVYACNNRCPHEGYPLKEGTLSGDCTLTCNWHNWKFDLRTGDNATGGDRLRVYPTRIENGIIQIDVADAPAQERIDEALNNLHDSFDRHEYDRMAREIARMDKAGGDPLDALRETIHWTHDRFEFGIGTTHAPMAAADWLSLRETRSHDEATRLMPIHESVASFAWDCQREPVFPYPATATPWDEDSFVAAVEAEDEETAIAHVRGGLDAGLGWTDMERGFARASLAHYLDFGHGAIYVLKTGELIAHLGEGVKKPLLLMLTRGLISAWREDLIPEFRNYAAELAGWNQSKDKMVTPNDFHGMGPKQAMALAARATQTPDDLYDVLLEMNAQSVLAFDLDVQDATDKAIAHNRTWLSVTHEITFANAARHLAQKYPELWPAALLQMCCFFGRNVEARDDTIRLDDWQVDDANTFLDQTLDSMFDHGQFEYIVTAHLIKTATAVKDEIDHKPDGPWKPTLLAALNRFLHSPLKRRHSMRTANQALSFVAIED
jgi:nitrite reductase/ring-hydroxylating ferredoxin subunit